MASEYHLTHTAAQIDELLDKAGNAVLYTDQSLGEAQKSKARANIGAATAGDYSGAIVCEATGAAISVTDAADRALKGLTLYGKTTQFTTTGKNLFDKDVNSPYSVSYVVDGVLNTRMGFGFGLPTGTYIAHVPSATSISNVYLYGCVRNSSGMRKQDVTILANTGIFKPTFTIAEGDILLLYHGASNATAEQTAALFTNYPVQIEAGTTATAYEPYTGGIPAPNPEYPQALESVGENIAVTVAGKNLFNPAVLTENGWTESDGVYSGAGQNLYGKTMPVGCGAKGAFTLSFLAKTPNATGSPLYIYINYTDGTRSAAITVQVHADEKLYTFTSDEGKAVDYLSFSYGTVGTLFMRNIQLEEGTIATAYEPYKPLQTMTATAEGGLRGLGEVKDEIDFARGVRVQRIYEKVFDGTESLENYAPTVTNGVRYYLNPQLSYEYRALSKCSHFSFNPYGWSAQENGQFKTVNPDYCVFRYDDYPTVDTFKAWLKQQYENGTPVTVQYVLAEPIETPLSAEELAAFATLHSNKPNTTAFNDSGAGMKLEYIADTKLYIDQKLAAISAAMLNA